MRALSMYDARPAGLLGLVGFIRFAGIFSGRQDGAALIAGYRRTKHGTEPGSDPAVARRTAPATTAPVARRTAPSNERR